MTHPVPDVVNESAADVQPSRAEAHHSAVVKHLLGVVGHELRNPLLVIRATARLMQSRGGLTEPQLRSLTRIDAATQRMNRIIADLLDYTLLEAGRGITLNPRACSMAELCELAESECALLAPGRTLRTDSHGDGRGDWDPDRIGQVLLNLLTNAFKYSPPDSEVTLCWRGMEEAVEVEVHNTGAPIPEALLPGIFDPFQQAASGRRMSGLGLGLFISREIVLAHGGSLQARSSAAEGTVFTLTLPRRLR